MKIGIDLQATQGRATGLGVYTANLVRALQNGKRSRDELICFRTEQLGNWNTIQRLLWENLSMPRLVRRSGVQLLHVPAFSPPWAKPCKLIVTVHDLIGMMFPNQRGWASRLYWGRWLPQRVRQADFIIADSESTREDLITQLQIRDNRIRVIYPSGHEGFLPQKKNPGLPGLKKRLGLRGEYFLSVGTLEPRKNMARILEAYSHFLRARTIPGDFQLALVGPLDFAHGLFAKELLQKTSLTPADLVVTGYLEQEDLNLLYSGSIALIFPSLYEGFGLPVLEAMASGTPVLTSQTSSLPEVGGEAAYYVDPCSVEEITEGMNCLANDSGLRSELIRKGYEQIKRFSWRQTAEETLKIYETVGHG